MRNIALIIFLLSIVNPGFASEFTMGHFKCSSGSYVRIDNGDVSINNIQNPYANAQFDYVPVKDDPYFVHYVRREGRKNTDIFVYSENEKFLFKRTINNDVFKSNMSDLKFDRKTFFRFRDQSVIGINFACRM